MKLTIISKDDTKSKALHLQIQNEFTKREPALSKIDKHFIVTVGGDGTLLHAIHEYWEIEDAIFIGIHTGTLGFLTECTENDIETFFEVLQRPLQIKENHLLQCDLFQDDKLMASHYAVNEFRVENILSTQEIEVYVNNEYLQLFRGNGMALASQLGSTAYNRSLGSAIIDESLDALILAEIAGIHHRHYRSLHSPLVLANTTHIKFMSKSFAKAKLLFDHLHSDLVNINRIEIKQSEKAIRFLRVNHQSYIKRLNMLF